MLLHYLIAVTTLTVVLGLGSRLLSGVPVSEPMIALTVGIVLGPQLFGYLEIPSARHEIFLILTRVLLSFTVMTAALRYPTQVVRSSVRPVAVLLVVVLPLMVATGTALAAGVLGLGWSAAFVLGAVLGPTDPVLVSSVVSGDSAERSLPLRLRSALSLESGANDGIGFFFVATALYAAQRHTTSWWGLHAVGGIVGGIAVGVVVGTVTGRLVEWTRRLGHQTDATFLLFSLTFSLFVLSICVAIGLDGILAVFVAGIAYSRAIGEDNRREQHTVEEGVDRLLLLPVFVLLGASLPWEDWTALGWKAIAFVALLLALRRLPWLVLAGGLMSLRLRERLWMGWFGPIGIAALFYASRSQDEGEPARVIWAVVTLVVATSTLVHGASALPERGLGRLITRDAQNDRRTATVVDHVRPRRSDPPSVMTDSDE